MLIKSKFNGYSSDGRRVYPCDDQPTPAGDTTVRNLSFPEQLQPYAEKLMGKVDKLTDKDYATYDYDRLAKFDPMQLQAQQAAANLGPSKQLGSATQMAGLAGLRAGELGYDPTTFGNQFTAPDKYSPTAFTNQFTAPTQYANTQFTYDKVSPTDQLGGTMTAAQMDAPANVSGFGGGTTAASTKSFTDPGTAASYMTPYTQNVTDIQTREADRLAGIEATKRGAAAVGAGAFGGSRQAIMDAEAARNLATQKGDITARGQQDAYQQAMAQFNAEQGYGLTAQQANLQAGLQSALANQQTGLTTGTQNLNAQQQANVQNLAAQLQTQGLNAQQAMQAALANQQAGITTQQASEQSKQFGYGQQMTAAQQAAQYGLAAQQAQEQANQFGANLGMTAAQQKAQYGLAGQQAAEQSKQFGANLGLQGIQQQLAAAGTMGQLGQTQFGQEKDVINAQANAGAQRQALDQAKKDIDYGDFQRQQQYDYQQLGFMSDLLRGAPMGNMTSTLYAAPPSALSTAAGLATTGYGLSRATGGVVQSDRGPAGLAELALQKTLGMRQS
jgi:hypothetical protein